MTGYTVHTGTSKKFSSGWDRIFGDPAEGGGKSGKAKKSGKKQAEKKAKAGKKATTKAKAKKSSKTKKK